LASVAGGVLLLVCGSCGTGSTPSAYPASAPIGPCAAVVQQQPIEGRTHVALCAVVDYRTNPPSSGNHYPIWASYKTYSSPIPEGFWVHDLEHGAVVLTYNCAVGAAADSGTCNDEIAAAAAMIASLPDDPECDALGQGVRRRSVLAPDPKLNVRFAASAWGWTLRADCFDDPVFRAFETAHYGHGPEDLCEDGEDPGAMGLPQNCGDE
jgi:hypothetical protein